MEQVISYTKKLDVDISICNKVTIDKLSLLATYYKSIIKLNKKTKDINLSISSKYIIELFTKLNHLNVLENNDINDLYSYDECLSLIENLCESLFKNKTNNYNKKLIINSINKCMHLIFDDMLLNIRKYNGLVKNKKIIRNNFIYDETNKVLSAIDENKVSDIELNEKYMFLCSNLIAENLFNDINETDDLSKIKYLIDIVNNTNDNYFDNLDILSILGILNFNNLTIDSLSKERNFTNNVYSKLVLTLVASIFVNDLLISSVHSENNTNICLNSTYNSYIANTCLSSIISDDALLSNTSIEDLDFYKDKIEIISDYDLNLKIDSLYDQYYDLRKAENKIASLFTNKDLTKVREDVTLKERFDVYNFLISLPQKDFVIENMKYINMVDEVLNKREIVELVETPFISQKDAKIYNGCEAASLLMSLQYKNKSLDYDLHKFVSEMPMHESDPHQGFVYSIYDYDPLDVAHWIAPDALAKFGSNYAKTYNVSGSSTDELKDFINNNKNVIVYVTANYNEPIMNEQEVPVNLHVVLLNGYNRETNEYVVIDPYHGKMNVEKEKFENSYNHLKYAVVVD